MKVTVYSRETVETIIRNKTFPPNTAVISFYDPAIKRIDEDLAVCHRRLAHYIASSMRR